MTFSVLWTVLPDGYVEGGVDTLQLSLVASPRIADNRSTVGQSPLADWPDFVRNLGDLAVEAKGETALTPAVKEGPQPDSELWKTMFSGSTRVATRGATDSPPQITASEASFTRAHESLRQIRQAAIEERSIAAAGRIAPAAGPSRVHRILDAAALLESGARPGETLGAAMTRLRAAGNPEAALAAPLAAYARALRAPERGARVEAVAGRPLGGIAPITAADFHQVLGLILTHPHLAKAVGLRLDLRIPAFSGHKSIRVVRADGRPLNGERTLPQPFSRVHADPEHRRFTMAPGPGTDPEVVAGMLAVAGDPSYVVSTTDVVGESLQIVAQGLARASALATGASELIDPSLPARRDLGITIARRDRPARVVTPSLERAAALHRTLTTSGELDESLELFSDDVTRGFRFDVSRDGRPFRSLMRRRVRTTVGSHELPAVEDEGRFEAFTGVEQVDENGVAHLTTGDEIAAWDGWAVGVPRPGLKVDTTPGSPVSAAPVPVQEMPGYGIRSEVSAVPGSLPRLRFGSTYVLRARAVDLAGNSIDPEVSDPAQTFASVPFLRTEGAPSPTIVARRRHTEGESLLRLVVRSNGGVPEGPACERHLAPPNASVALAERHGMLDAAYGNRAGQAIRDEMLALARREAGSFLDPVVPGRNGAPVRAPGLAVVTNDPQAPPPVTLPVPRGQALPNGAYVILDTDHARLPYLADPVVEGVALIGFPDGPVIAAYGATNWPTVEPIRLIVRPTSRTRPDVSAEVIDDGGRPALLVHVPPGLEATVELSSTIRRGMVAHLDTAGATAREVVSGLVPEVSPRQEVTIVHAVRVPAERPRIIGDVEPQTAPDGAGYSATATVAVHEATTAQVDVEATWTEVSDPGVGELVEQPRVLRVGSGVVERGATGTVDVPISQLFGDGRHRRIALTPWATTRFREYFKPVPDGDRSMQSAALAPTTISVPNRSRPAPPKVHSVLPLFKWTRGVDATGRFAQRTTVGLRVWLERPWLSTGEGELLGVVVPTQPPPTGLELARLQNLVSRWGSDPLELRPAAAPSPLTSANFTGGRPPERLRLAQAGGGVAQVFGFEVRFDAERQLWFADVGLTVTDEPWPFVRLGLVRYQPASLRDEDDELSGERVISRVVLTDFAQLPPSRKVSFNRVGATGVRARVSGPRTENSVFRIRQERFMPDPFDASTGLASDAGVGAADGWTVTEGPTGNQLRADLLLSFPGGSPGTAVMGELEAGRIVVEELQTGLSLLSPTTSERVVFTEAVARSAV